MYVSVTGLTVRGPLQVPLFWRHALPSMVQARRSAGNLFADARKVEGVQQTLTVWTDWAAMRAFLTSGAHLQAMRAFHRVGSGRTCGFEADHVPSWEQALVHWREHAREY